MKNSIGLVGRKAGMTRVFTDAGETVPVTVIEVWIPTVYRKPLIEPFYHDTMVW